MTIEGLRSICRSLPGVTEDVKWGSDLCFLVGGKMFVVVNLEPPHQVAFKCTPDAFGELVEPEASVRHEQVGELRVVRPVATISCGVDRLGR